jgi:CheY-like chemotaxis protein
MEISRFMKAKVRILVVEDEMPVAMPMAHLLTRVGCETKVALTARQGLYLAGQEIFDLITLDVDLPGMNSLCEPLDWLAEHSCGDITRFNHSGLYAQWICER